MRDPQVRFCERRSGAIPAPTRLDSVGFAPEVLVTDRLGSYGAAKRKLGLLARHEQGLRKNNRAENSHQPTRRRAQDAALQVVRIGPALFVRPCCRSQHVQHPAPPRSRRTLRQFRAEAAVMWEAATAA